MGVARFGRPAGLVEPLLDAGQVGQPQLDVDDLPIAHRIDFAHDVLHIGVFEAADHVEYGVDFADIRQELVPQPLSLAGALHQTGDVHELHRRRHRALGLHDLGQSLEPPVGYLYDPGVGLDGSKGIVRYQCLRGREGVEESGFSDVGKAYDSES